MPVIAMPIDAPVAERAPDAMAAHDRLAHRALLARASLEGTPSSDAFSVVRVGDHAADARRRCDPGIAVSRAPSNPPVQLSATPMVSPFARQRSSTTAARSAPSSP